MNSHGLSAENLLAALPVALQRDLSMVALAQAAADLLVRRPEEIDRLRIYPAIDQLDEELMDILARDFKVDWWDPEYSIDEKRQTLKDNWRVHKLMGTKAAVVTAISAIYPHTKVLEWFEYGGEPYHFRLDINITNDSIDSAKQRRVLERLNFYKSLRSHNDGVTYFVEARPAVVRACACVPGVWEHTRVSLVLPVPVIRLVASARTGVATALWETFAAAVDIPFPALQSAAYARVSALAGLQETFIARAPLPIDPPQGRAQLRAGTASAWQEHYTARAVPLTEQAWDSAGGAVTQ